MIFEVIAEDRSGEKMLNVLIPKILLGHGKHEFRITVASTLKNQLLQKTGKRITSSQHKPLLLKVIGGQLKAIAATIQKGEIVVIVIDSDGESPKKLLNKIQKLIAECSPEPPTLVTLAVEEGEAWFLGDKAAIKKAFPDAKDLELDKYATTPQENGTWEILANAISPGGSAALKTVGYPKIGIEKCLWADKISPHMNVEANVSPSFLVFRNGMREKAKSTS